MFKKPVSYAGNHKLSGKDLKRLKKELAAKLPSADDAALELLLPSKGGCSPPPMHTINSISPRCRPSRSCRRTRLP
jgi:hypothetical protein